MSQAAGLPQDPAARQSSWPRISIVTPSLNQGATIEETIRSVLDQGYPDLDYQVVDGGSNDDTLAVLARFAGRLRWRSEPDRGQAHAINKGLAAATGDLLAYLNADDTYLPGALEHVAAAHRERPEVGLIYGDCLAVWADGSPKGVIRGRPFDLTRSIRRGEFVPQQAAFWTRRAMDLAGRLDEELHLSLDYDWFIRLGRVAPALYLPRTLACFRFTPTTKSSTQAERHWRESFAVSRRHGLRPWQVWFWLRLARHYGLAALPARLQARVRRALDRPHDPCLTREERG